jgi:hypothetical protein
MPVDRSASPPVLARLVCEGWPAHGFAGFEGRQDIQVELQVRDGLEPGAHEDGTRWVWTTPITLKPLPDGGVDFAGPAVSGKRGERFFYLSWSSRTLHGRDRFRRAKIQLRELTPAQLAGLLKRGGTITARISALARDGGPACATVPFLGGGWTTS